MDSYAYSARTSRLNEWTRGTVARIRTAVAGFSRRVAGLFLFVLLVQPTGVGRGGR